MRKFFNGLTQIPSSAPVLNSYINYNKFKNFYSLGTREYRMSLRKIWRLQNNSELISCICSSPFDIASPKIMVHLWETNLLSYSTFSIIVNKLYLNLTSCRCSQIFLLFLFSTVVTPKSLILLLSSLVFISSLI